MRDALVWRTLKPFQPSRISLSELRRAPSAAPRASAASAPAPTMTAGRSALAKASVTSFGSLPSSLRSLPIQLDPHAEVDFRPDGEDLRRPCAATLRSRVLISGASQRRLEPTSRMTSALSMPAIVELKFTAPRLDWCHRSGRSGALRAGSSPAPPAAPWPHTWSRHRAGRRRSPRRSRPPSSAARRTVPAPRVQLASRSLPFSRTHGRSSRLRTSASTWWRVLSLIHSSFTSSLMRGRMRMTCRWRTSRRMFEPTASMTSMPGTRRKLPRARSRTPAASAAARRPGRHRRDCRPSPLTAFSR